MVGGQLMRIPYTAPLPAPTIIPSAAASVSGAIAALTDFLTSTPQLRNKHKDKTVLLTGAGISVASGLADYRGTKGTYTLNKTYRPIYFHEFVANHAARKRYWARSFLGWTNLNKSKPNPAHKAVADLGRMGYLSSVITQNVDSFHPQAHPSLRTLELHGYLRSAVCTTCRTEYDRQLFQNDLAALNPAWSDFLNEMLASGALTTENPDERRRLGLKTNPDGDVDVPGVDYATFRYPACPTCLAKPPQDKDGKKHVIEVDVDGAWVAGNSTAGILKPNVIMFGESIPDTTKTAAELAIDEASRVLVLGSSLATYSAWRLVKRAREQGMPIGIVNIGGVRGEEQFFSHLGENSNGKEGLRCAHILEEMLPNLAKELGQKNTTPFTASGMARPFVPAPWA
ncbi:DHS-like NAD/FAD-binding domain-containing protein [Aureobasidium pullulans]|uniref:DHS-like NAD/FAD-binding domain-containing protein n=1 Tax=Aureobasidium pullulans TaxID=5580 RepID=A0A4S9XF62_AURPU|nr:DHS-like NAD/FAD-binding domain-containing protein [Aureobasidium pullulans]